MKVAIGWTVFCVVAAILLASSFDKPEVLTGDTIDFSITSSYEFKLDGDATVEADSADFFAFYDGKSLLVGTPESKPIGWKKNSYYKLKPASLSKGTWSVEAGTDIEVRINSPSANSVTILLKEYVADKGKMSIYIAIAIMWSIVLLAIIYMHID